MGEFREVGDRVWVARYDWLDLNVSVIGGTRGLVVVDTHASTTAAAEIVADLRRLGAGQVIAVVNTHDHFDHWFGNAALRTAYGELPAYAHETAAAAMLTDGPAIRAAALAHCDPARAAEITATELVPPTESFSSVRLVDLGDRAIELVHPGRGHTGGDLVVCVPDAAVLVAGDLVEESGPPAYGDDSFPLDWPAALDSILGLTTPSGVIVPGHGRPVDRDFVEDQRGGVSMVAATIRELAAAGVPQADALAASTWPFPVASLGAAVRRGYAQLAPGERRLPLV